jgi:hypothetical protein
MQGKFSLSAIFAVSISSCPGSLIVNRQPWSQEWPFDILAAGGFIHDCCNGPKVDRAL